MFSGIKRHQRTQQQQLLGRIPPLHPEHLTVLLIPLLLLPYRTLTVARVEEKEVQLRR